MSDLTDRIRAKYPNEYKDMSDEDLEKSVLEKHPEYKDLAKQPSEINATISSKPDETKSASELDIPANKLTQSEAKFNIGDQTPPESEGFLSKLWRQQTTPLTDLPERVSNKVSELVDPERGTTGPRAYGSAFIEGIGKAISSLTTPLNLETMGASSGAAMAGKAGLETIANALSRTSQGLSLPVVAEGAKEVITGEHASDKLSGLLELAGGVLGMRGHIGDIADRAIKPSEAISEEMPNLANDSIPSKPQVHPELPPDMVPVGGENEFNLTRPEQGVPSPVNEDKLYRLASEKQGMGAAPPEETKLEPTPVNKLSDALASAAPLEKEQSEIYSQERGERISDAIKVGTPGRQGFFERKGKLAGEHTKVDFEPLESKLKPSDIDQLHETINNHPDLSPYDKISASEGLEKMLRGSVPQAGQIEKLSKVFGADLTDKFERFYPENKQSKLQQAYDLPRGLMSVDPPFITSAAFRQGASLIGTKAWWASWADAAKSYPSRTIASDIQQEINSKSLFRPNKSFLNDAGEPISYREKVGLKQGDLTKYSKRDEPIRGELAEKIPAYGKMVRGSNRAFTAFTNRLSADTFENLIIDAEKQGLDPTGKNLALGKEIADFVNTAVRRGKIGIEAGSHELNLEKHARALSNVLFSPRSISSQIRMLNPSTYVMAQPFVRRQYLAAMVRQVGTWWTIAEVASLLSKNVTVSHDANSADFGKIKIGNVRIDPPGGLQQFLVLGHRMMPAQLGGGGTTSTNTGKFTEFGKGYKPATRMSTLTDFATNRLHPTAKMAYDLLNVTQGQPFHVGDKIAQMAMPMYASDLIQVAKDNPDLAPIILGAAGAGMGTQDYDKGSFGKPVFIPEKYDLTIGGK